MKGTDHKGSADMNTFHQMVHDIRSLEFSIGDWKLERDPSVAVAKEKLERSLAYKRDIEPGEIITEEDLHMISPGNGLKWSDRDKVIGKIVASKIDKNTLVTPYE